MLFGVANDGDAAAVGEHRVALGYGGNGVIRPFAVHVRPKQRQQRRNRRLIEDRHVIDAAERRDELRALGRGQDRTPRAF